MAGGGPGGSDIGVFRIDPDELDDVIADLEKTETGLDRITDDLERQMRLLHEVWEGLAAQAHTEAHQQWTEGMREMRQAMTDLRSAARLAHGNYLAAGSANLDMWGELT